MKIDLSVSVSQETYKKVWKFTFPDDNEVFMVSCLGTYMVLTDGNLRFGLDMNEPPGIIFDICAIKDRELQPEDIDLAKVQEGDFVVFHTGSLDRFGYGNDDYFLHEAPLFSYALIDALLDKKVALIGMDKHFLRKREEYLTTEWRLHGERIADEYCAARGVFVVKSLANLKRLLKKAKDGRFAARINPLNYVDALCLPRRVIAEV
jgi:kynurenine formamidase